MSWISWFRMYAVWTLRGMLAKMKVLLCMCGYVERGLQPVAGFCLGWLAPIKDKKGWVLSIPWRNILTPTAFWERKWMQGCRCSQRPFDWKSWFWSTIKEHYMKHYNWPAYENLWESVAGGHPINLTRVSFISIALVYHFFRNICGSQINLAASR